MTKNIVTAFKTNLPYLFTAKALNKIIIIKKQDISFALV